MKRPVVMWQRYGYLLASRVGTAGLRACGLRSYSGVSRDEVWPVIDEAYYSTQAEKVSPDLRRAYAEIVQDPSDFLFLRVSRSVEALRRIAAFISAFGGDFEALAVDVDTDNNLPPCEDLDVMWYGFEPYARGEWGLLSLIEPSSSLALWGNKLNKYGLFSAPDSCLAFAAAYRQAMGRPRGPEPIADESPIDILRVGLVPSLRTSANY